jgi:hypothetical protein
LNRLSDALGQLEARLRSLEVPSLERLQPGLPVEQVTEILGTAFGSPVPPTTRRVVLVAERHTCSDRGGSRCPARARDVLASIVVAERCGNVCFDDRRGAARSFDELIEVWIDALDLGLYYDHEKDNWAAHDPLLLRERHGGSLALNV